MDWRRTGSQPLSQCILRDTGTTGVGIIDATGTGALYNVLCALLRLYHPGSLGGPDDRNALVLTAQAM